ncbi:MAG: HEAT repeat domain-containing protein [Elusimicrobia bacterium]|nr:HEAT repeat domain-containing protein [Elusimicrobiota bacterium]
MGPIDRFWRLPRLARALRSAASVRDRSAAASRLAQLGGPEARAALEEVLLRDANLMVREAAARALGRLGDRACVPALKKLLEPGFLEPSRGSGLEAGDDTARLRAACRAALDALGAP